MLDSENDGGHHSLLLLANEPEETQEDDTVNIITSRDSDDSSDEIDNCDRVNAVEDVSIWNPVPLLELEWEAGALLKLRQELFLPFEALFSVSDAIHEHHVRKTKQIQVCGHDDMKKCLLNKLINVI